MADANTMIRCIIGDDEQKINELQEIRSTQKIIYTVEVIAEVVYVLSKVYNVSRKDTSDAIQRFLKARNIVCHNYGIAQKALQLFAVAYTTVIYEFTEFIGQNWMKVVNYIKFFMMSCSTLPTVSESVVSSNPQQDTIPV